ncbi:Fur-regulated basic protein FbpA [Bacillus sp. RO1]|uniref:Fur-regulated basic protein FbpA n=1 Tax=Bacillus sp. RO1 TaxID=2722703 RepID=UPI0014574E2D|nr:Fur-regulated basic protein FbpA [Bacillus sp. RO1]NLP52663.1 Fur-regulated basic protein FbpA [Bacillus sp. RO1]
MAKILEKAISDAKEYYITKLVNAGFFMNHSVLSTYTLSELKKEYTNLIKKGGDKGAGVSKY